MAPSRETRTKFRVLAIEPDPDRGRTLKQLVRDRLGVDLVVASSSDAAIAAMSERAPDLILSSALVSPSDDSRLTAYLREFDDVGDLPVLTIPPVVDVDQRAGSTLRWPFSIFKRRGAAPWPAYDAEAVSRRIEEALRRPRIIGGRAKVRRLALVEKPLEAEVNNDWTESATVVDQALLNHCGLGIKRLRAHRWEPGELPWLSSINLPWGLEVQLLNISSSGLLIESGAKFAPGSATAFHLYGPDKNMILPARIVRTHVSIVDGRGVRYHAAATFDRDVDLLTQRPLSHTRSVAAPKVLADLLAQVMIELEAGAEPAALRNSFQQGLRRLVRARAIEIRDVPAASHDGGDSIYFTVPTNKSIPAILQATFEPNHQPQEEEFRILKGAATLAAFILQFEDRPPVQASHLVFPTGRVVNAW